ncbi:uncharacterized protein [Littorina saxatilis]|uniref:Ubiquitin-like domain-containing protein n=1 Tax=Littorina saxatilis TaxID=31220 RepID=A0AAN9C3R4_9CAEN
MATNKIDVYVKIPTGRNAHYYVTTHDTIETLCKTVAEEEKVKATQVRMKYQGKTLNRDHTMGHLGVRPETILKAEILVPRPVNLIVALPNDLGETELTTTSLDTVADVVGRLADIVKEEKSRVVLKFEGRTVKGHTLLDAGLVDGSALQVEIAEPKAKSNMTELAAAPEVGKTKEMDEEDKQAILGSFETDGRPVEVVFSFDTTGSMHGCLVEVRTKLRECCTRLIQDISNIRIGIIAHGDYCDAQNTYVVRSLDLTSDVQAIADFVDNVPKTGGGDSPECYEWALKKAQGLDWSEESAKALVVIGDAVPHYPAYTDANVFWKDELSLLTGMGIKVYGVHAGNTSQAAAFYEELAEVSGGHYLTLGHFDVITDMFLAVCYRESNEENLEAFVKEVEEAGRMTEERRQMFNRLEKNQAPAAQHNQQQNENEQIPSRYVAAAWWDPTLTQRHEKKPLYCYDQETDDFKSSPKTGTTPIRRSTSAPGKSSTRKCSSGKKCVIM